MAMVKLSKEEFLKMVMARQRRKQTLKDKANKEIDSILGERAIRNLKHKRK